MKKRNAFALGTMLLLACIMLASCAENAAQSHNKVMNGIKTLKNYEAVSVSLMKLEAVSISDMSDSDIQPGDLDGTLYRVEYKTDGKNTYYSTSNGMKVYFVDGVMYQLDGSDGSKTKPKATKQQFENYRMSLFPPLLKYDLPQSLFEGVKPTEGENGELTYTLSVPENVYYNITKQEVVSHVEFKYTVDKEGQLVSAVQSTNIEENGFVMGEVTSITLKNIGGVKAISKPSDSAEYK